MSDDLACVLYVDTNIPREELMAILVSITGGKSAKAILQVEENEIEIIDNDDFNPIEKVKFPDGFLFFRYRVEIFPLLNRNADLNTQIALVSGILNALWERNISAVASCDYEDQLPHNGGYKSPMVPFPQ